MRIFMLAISAFLLLGANFSGPSGGIITAAHASTDAESSSEFEYYELPPLLIPVINARGLSQQVSLVVSIEVPTGKLEEVALYAPRLTDAYIQDMYGVLSAGYGLVNGNVLNVSAIKQRLSKVTVNVLGEELVEDVLLQIVQQRPL
jgi:flagellar FliL protein